MLYWMIAYRRTSWNFALDRAVEWAKKPRKPLVILEALRCDYRWASSRMHRFVIDGMAENARRFEGTNVLYYPYLEATSNAGKGLLAALASHPHCSDGRLPLLFPPTYGRIRGPAGLSADGEGDSNGLLPIRQGRNLYPTAYAFRRFLQNELPRHLMEFPKPNALLRAKLPKAKTLPREIVKRWPKASPGLLNSKGSVLPGISLNHEVRAVETGGGSTAAQALLRMFLQNKLPTYLHAQMTQRNRPRVNSLPIFILGIFPCIRFSWNSRRMSAGLPSTSPCAQRAAVLVGGVLAKTLTLFWTRSSLGGNLASIVARCEKTMTNSTHCRRGHSRL